VPTGPLVGYWKLDEPNGKDPVVDSSGNGNTGTAYGTSVVEGKFNRARRFSGKGDYIEIPSINIRDAITVAAWVYADNFMQSGFVITKNPIDTQWALFFQGNRLLKWRGIGAGDNVMCPAPSDGVWHHIVAKQEGTTGSLYIDGALCSRATQPAIGNGASLINIGRFDSGDHWYFNGLIDEVRIYNRALSDKEVAELFTTNSSPPVSPAPATQLKNDAGGDNANSKL
jgi:hypothetical protein